MKANTFAKATALALIAVQPALADFNRWSTETETDPFTKGTTISVNYTISMRSVVYMFCDTSRAGLMVVRLVPGFEYSDDLKDYKPEMEIAIDGDYLLKVSTGKTGSVGANLASADFAVFGEDMRKIVDAMKVAKKQIAIKDGISDRPYLLSARGSTSAATKLEACVQKPPA